MIRSLLAAAAASALLAAAFGCGPKKTDPKPVVDQDKDSGPDGKRSGAAPIEINKLVTDDVSFDKFDMTDWKSVELKGKPGLLTVNIHWDNDKSDMNVDLFDGFGTQVATSPGPSPGTQDKKLVVQINTLGVYYIRNQAPKAHDGSVYTVEAQWNDQVEEAPPPEEKPEEKPQPKPKPIAHEHHQRPQKEFLPETGVQGRVVSFYREGGTSVLHIDKGTAAGVKVGNTGTILDGPTGANALEGGSFRITEVIDDSKCIGKTALHSIGHNTRVSINVAR
jgi:hypothetical protein